MNPAENCLNHDICAVIMQPTIHNGVNSLKAISLAPDLYVKQVGNSFETSSLNFQNMIFHSLVTDFIKEESDSGLSVKLVLEGQETYTIDNIRHHIRPGNFLLVNEHQQFKCHVQSTKLVEGLCIYLDPDMVREAYVSNTLGHGHMLDCEGKADLPDINFVEKIYALGENRLGGFLREVSPTLRNPEARNKVDFEKFFLDLTENLVSSQREVRQLLGKLEMERPATRKEIFRRVSIARNYIDENFLEDISLDLLAEMSFLSKYHFLRCFKQVYGKSPYQYLLIRRLEKGKELLHCHHHTLTEIAYLTGFTDRRAFNKAFKKAIGISPGGYREQL